MNEVFKSPNESLNSRHFVLMKWFVFWLLLTFVAVLFTGAFYVARSSSGQDFSAFDLIASQMLRFQAWSFLSILIIWFDRFFRARSRSWLFLFPVHFVTSIIWAFVAVLVFGLSFRLIDGLVNSDPSPLAEIFPALGMMAFVMGILAYKIILTTNYALDYYKKFQDEKHRTARLEAQLAQAQLQALKMQLQPHFLFNTLNSISNLALEDPRKTVQMIARLGDFLRLTIDSNGTQKMSLEQEIGFLKNYLEIEQVRFQDRLRVEIDVAPEACSAEVPNLILQPLVENAIKHGIAKSVSAGEISIDANRNGENLLITIQNDGTFLNGNGAGKKGVGLANTRERLEQLYGKNFRFELKPLDEGGARVELEIPFREVGGDG